MPKSAPITIVSVGYRSTNYWVVSAGASRILIDLGYPGTMGTMRARLRFVFTNQASPTSLSRVSPPALLRPLPLHPKHHPLFDEQIAVFQRRVFVQ